MGLGIDRLLVVETVAGEVDVHGRTAPVTDVCLVLLAAARWALHRGARRTTQLLLILPVVVGSLAQLGYLFQVEQLYSVVASSTVALPTALSLVLLGLGIACLIPGGVAWWVAKDPGPGATLARHLLPVAVLLLPVLAVLPILGLYTDVFGQRFSIALMVAASATVLLVVTMIAARRLDRIDRERLAAQDQLRRLNDKLREGRDLEWRRAEALSRDLEEERVRYRRAISKVEDLIWTVQVLPDGALEPEFTSGDASGLYGGENPEVEERGRTIPNRVHPADRELLAAFDDRIRAGEPAGSSSASSGTTTWCAGPGSGRPPAASATSCSRTGSPPTSPSVASSPSDASSCCPWSRSRCASSSSSTSCATSCWR